MSEPGERQATDPGTQEQTPADVARMFVSAAPPMQPGDPVPNLEMWVLVRKLGGGGFGEVWLARHERKGEAAVKFCTDPKARHKLVTHERTVVARVMKHGGNHPNVVPLLECNLSGEIPWLMYEYVAGGTLAEAVAEWRDLPPPRRLGRAVRVLHALTGALGTFHRLDPPLVHRDLKPQNILMKGHTPRITDFGIGGAALEASHPDLPTDSSGLAARIPTLLQTAGSSRYAPPEQIFGSPPDPRDDVYALGVIAYQLVLADLRAIPGSDVVKELRALRIPAELVSLIVKSVALDPARRPRDAAEWDAALAALVKKKTAGSKVMPSLSDLPKDEPTEELQAVGESEIAAAAVSQTLDVGARGRWYARPAGQPAAPWVLVATTPAAVKVVPGEVYRFSINSTATPRDAAAVAALAGLGSLRYLNLSYCAAVTDDLLARLPGFPGLRQLFVRGCPNVTDAGVLHLHRLSDLLTLEIADCKQLTPAALTALRAALPKCKILA